jgi:hypothetical protein
VLGGGPCRAGGKRHFAINPQLNFHQIGFFGTERCINFRNERVGKLLDLILTSTFIVLRDLFFLYELFEHAVRITPGTSNGHPR